MYINSTGGTLYAFDAATGAVLWEAQVGNKGHYKSPAVGDGAVYLSDDEHLHAFDAAKGDRLWKVEARVAIDSRMTVADGVLYFSTGGRLNALDPTSGSHLWDIGEGGGMDLLPVHESVLYVGDGSFLVALDVGTGETIWKYAADGIVLAPPLVSDGVVYFGATDDYLYALTTDPDAPSWSSAPTPTPTPTRTPVTSLAELKSPKVAPD